MLTVTYRNTTTGALKTISFHRPMGSNSDNLVATYIKVVCKATGWNRKEVAPQMVIVQA